MRHDFLETLRSSPRSSKILSEANGEAEWDATSLRYNTISKRFNAASIGLIAFFILGAFACAPGLDLVAQAPSPIPSATALPPTPAPPTPTNTALPTASPAASATIHPTQTAAASATGTPAATAPGTVVISDDFSVPANGWSTSDKPALAIDYSAGEYRVIVKAADVTSWSTPPDLSLGDVSVEADMRMVSGPDTSLFGLLCRADTKPVLSSGYEIIISTAGKVSIAKVTGTRAGDEKVLTSGTTPLVLRGDATNHLRADCIGDDIAMYVNGHKIVDVHDADYAKGQVGFIFGSQPNTAGFDVRFDNFLVRQVVH